VVGVVDTLLQIAVASVLGGLLGLLTRRWFARQFASRWAPSSGETGVTFFHWFYTVSYAGFILIGCVVLLGRWLGFF
jgi:hypothetical protein